jgi:hypothetical protein
MLMQAHCRWKMHKPTSGALLPYQMHTFYGTSNLEPICLQCKLREPRATIDTTTCLSTIRCKYKYSKDRQIDSRNTFLDGPKHTHN